MEILKEYKELVYEYGEIAPVIAKRYAYQIDNSVFRFTSKGYKSLQSVLDRIKSETGTLDITTESVSKVRLGACENCFSCSVKETFHGTSYSCKILDCELMTLRAKAPENVCPLRKWIL